MEIRKVYAPYSKTGEQVGQTPVEGYIDVNQAIYPNVDTGIINENGEWVGLKSSDKEFHAFGKDVGIPNTGEILSPQQTGDAWPLDMTGFNDLFIAIKPTSAGNYKIEAIMGPDSNSFANLSPVNPASVLRGNEPTNPTILANQLVDSADALSGDVWNIFNIKDVLRNQKLLQFKITNNSGSESDIETAYMRIV